jgi:hypothetical protein
VQKENIEPWQLAVFRTPLFSWNYTPPEFPKTLLKKPKCINLAQNIFEAFLPIRSRTES